jgi:hypothetical protein
MTTPPKHLHLQVLVEEDRTILELTAQPSLRQSCNIMKTIFTSNHHLIFCLDYAGSEEKKAFLLLFDSQHHRAWHSDLLYFVRQQQQLAAC